MIDAQRRGTVGSHKDDRFIHWQAKLTTKESTTITKESLLGADKGNSVTGLLGWSDACMKPLVVHAGIIKPASVNDDDAGLVLKAAVAQ